MKKEVLKKREEVIIKSSKLFYYQGYVNTGVSEILEECNIPKGSFYYYFKNKDDLLKEVINLHTNNLISFFDKTVNDLSTVKLRMFFSQYFNTIIKNQCHGGSLLGNLAMEISDINEELREIIDKSYKKIELRITAFLHMLKNTNMSYKHINPETLSKILINQMEGTMLRLKVSRLESDTDSFFNMYDYFMYG